MSKDEKENRSQPRSGALDKFEPGGELGPLDDRNNYQQRLNWLPAGQKDLAEESTRFAELSQQAPHAINATSQAVQAVGQWKAKTATHATRNFRLRARAFTDRPQYCPKTRTLAASPSASTSRSKRWISRRPSSKGLEMFPSFR